MLRSRSSKRSCGIGVARGELGQRVALRHEPALAGLQRRFGVELLADVVKDGEDRRLAVPGRRRRDEASAQNGSPLARLMLQPQVVRAAVAPDPLGQLRPLRRVRRSSR